MTIMVPTTAEEWRNANDSASSCLLVSRTEKGVPRWTSVNSAGECESFQSLDGALLWALDMIDVRTSPQGEVAAAMERHLYDREGQAILFLNKKTEELERTIDET